MIALEIQLDFDKVEKRDLFIFISGLEQSESSQLLKHDYKTTLKSSTNSTVKRTIPN